MSSRTRSGPPPDHVVIGVGVPVGGAWDHPARSYSHTYPGVRSVVQPTRGAVI
jgi:hypothetical protein